MCIVQTEKAIAVNKKQKTDKIERIIRTGGRYPNYNEEING